MDFSFRLNKLSLGDPNEEKTSNVYKAAAAIHLHHRLLPRSLFQYPQLRLQSSTQNEQGSPKALPCNVWPCLADEDLWSLRVVGVFLLSFQQQAEQGELKAVAALPEPTKQRAKAKRSVWILPP